MGALENALNDDCNKGQVIELLIASRQENRELEAEVAGLRQQVEDAEWWHEYQRLGWPIDWALRRKMRVQLEADAARTAAEDS